MPITDLTIHTPGQGLHEITHDVLEAITPFRVETGLLTVFIRHTSASLMIQENADPSARRDLEKWLNRHVPENDPLYTHTDEGPDDMPSHIKAAITATSLTIPIENHRPTLGTWQGIYLWEHRRMPHVRKVTIHAAAD
ncbi:MAG: secondary thiamine-phosphate synthase enzyme YjbQ [Planctomycetota bacterium]